MYYTQTQHYSDYIEYKAVGDVELALRSLKLCLEDPIVQADPIQHADLLQRIGALLFEKGDAEGAIICFNQAEKCDPTSLLILYYYAKFLAESMCQFEKAITKCDIIITRAQDSPFPESDDDFSSEQYIQMANSLKEEIKVHQDKP